MRVSIRFPVVRTDGRSFGQRTVTWLPNFLGSVDLLTHDFPLALASHARELRYDSVTNGNLWFCRFHINELFIQISIIFFSFSFLLALAGVIFMLEYHQPIYQVYRSKKYWYLHLTSSTFYFSLFYSISQQHLISLKISVRYNLIPFFPRKSISSKPFSVHSILGFRLLVLNVSSKVLVKVSVFLSFRGLIQTYLPKTSITISKYLTPSFHLLNFCISTKSAAEISSIPWYYSSLWKFSCDWFMKFIGWLLRPITVNQRRFALFICKPNPSLKSCSLTPLWNFTVRNLV